MRRLLIVVLSVLVAGASALLVALSTPSGLDTLWPYLPASIKTRPSLYLRSALSTIERHAIQRGTVDWPAVHAHAKELAKDAKTAADTHPAIRYALEQLKDGHSTLAVQTSANNGPQGAFGFMTLFPEKVVAIVYPESAAARAGVRAGDVIEQVNGAPPTGSTDPRTRGYFVNIPPPTATLRLTHPGEKEARDVSLTVGSYSQLPALGQRRDKDLGYVEIPATTGADNFAERVRESIQAADAPTVCGWIVDLRFNNGGEMWAMLQALRPIIGEGPLGSFAGLSGQTVAWTYPTSGPFALSRPEHGLLRTDPPVAVLTSRLTARAGELTAVAFRGRPETRSFGEPTWGSPFENTSFVLPDRARIDLATSKAVDRTGKAYDGRIAPDEAVTIDWAKLTAADDPLIVAAGTWLRAQAGCKK